MTIPTNHPNILTNPAESLELIDLALTDLPSFMTNRRDSNVTQITHYLRRLLARFQAPHTHPSLKLPSVMRLSGFFHCSELDILEALHRLGNQSYDFEVRGLDTGIRLQDPLCRRSETSGSQRQPSALAANH
jgi:hypothetical protein